MIFVATHDYPKKRSNAAAMQQVIHKEKTFLHLDGGGQGELHGRAGKGGPHDDGLGADLVGGSLARGGRRAARESDRDGGTALVAGGGDGHGGDSLTVGRVGV